MPPSIEDLFARFAASGEPGRLGEVFDRCSGELLSLALHLCGRPGDAEDALQATFVTAIEKRGEWDSSRRLVPWLSGILVLHCRKLHERRARRREAELVDLVGDDGSVVAANERRELVERLRVHVATLPAEQRSVLLLQLEHGLEPAQIAEVLGVAPGTVRMRIWRGLKALRGVLPAGMVAMFAALLGARLPARGVAAVRQAVVRHAASLGPFVATAGGALLMKKLSIGAALALVLCIAWYASRPAPLPPAPSSSATPSPTPAVAHVPAAPAAAPTARDAVDPAPPASRGTPCAATLLVRVVQDPAREPLANVPLAVVPIRGDSDPVFDVRDGITGVDGTATFALPEDGPYRVDAVGGLSEVVAIHDHADATVELHVTDDPSARHCLVRGRVVHADGSPAAGATLVVSASGSDRVGIAGTADAAGRFELPVVAAFSLIGAHAEGSAPSRLQGCLPERDIELVLPGPGATLSGVVVDASGAPVASANVWIREGSRDQQFDPRGFVIETRTPVRLATASDGTFCAADVPAGELRLEVRTDGRPPCRRYVDLAAGQTTAVRCVLDGESSIRGVVVDQHDAPVAGASVLLEDSETETRTTDADGRFGFRSAPPTLQAVRIEAPDIVPRSAERDVTSEPGEWRIVAQRLPHFVLRFVDEHGGPLAGWRVVARASVFRPYTTDADGRCSVPAPSDDLGDLAVAPPGNGRATVACAWPIGMVPDVESTIVVPTASHPSAVITGRVRSPDDAPLAAGRVAVLRPDGSYLAWCVTEAGAFRTIALPPGDYVLEVHREGRGAAGARYRVAALQRGEVRDVGALQLPPEGMLSLHIVRADGSEPDRAGVYLYDADHLEHFAPPADGRPHPWPAGRYEWLVMDDASLWQRGTIDVEVGATATIDVALRTAVRRTLLFPLPTPAWGTPQRVDYELRAPDGSVYDRGDFDPRDELPFRYCPPLETGRWVLELRTDAGQRFAGVFELQSLTPSLEPIRIAVTAQR